MPTKLTAYTETAIMPSLFKGVACPTPPTGHEIKLYKTDVTEAGTGTEITGAGYAPFGVTFAAPALIDGTDDYRCANPTRVESAEATGVWDLDTDLLIVDGAGNGLVYADVTKISEPPEAVGIGDKWKAEAGVIFVTLAGALSAAVKQAVLNWTLRGATFTPLTAAKLAMYDGAGTEITGSGYARLDIALGALTDDGAGSHYYANSDALAASYSGTITVAQLGLLTADGTVIIKGALSAAKTFGPGIDFAAAAGALKFKLG